MKQHVIRLRFGKYNGRAIENVPASYLKWCLENVDGSLEESTRMEIRRVLRKWDSMSKQVK